MLCHKLPMATGYCGAVSFADARAFGPPMWHALHLIAQNYPGGIGDTDTPNNATIAACEHFTFGLPWMLPGHGAYFKSLLEAHPLKCVNGTYLQDAMVSAHNNISGHVGGPDRWTLQQAATAYTTVSKCLTDIQWGNKELCRVNMTNATVQQHCTTGPNAACDSCIPWVGKFKPKGYCGPVFSANPRVFGPWLWQTLHVIAEFYPDVPNSATVVACQKFTSSLPLMLPCDHCGYHLNETIHMYTGEPICASSRALQTFLVYGHNRVSQNVHPNRTNWTYDQATDHYRETHLCLHNNEVTLGNLSLSRGITFPPDTPGTDISAAVAALVSAVVLLFVGVLWLYYTRTTTRQGEYGIELQTIRPTKLAPSRANGDTPLTL